MSEGRQRGFGSFLKEAAWATLIAIGVVSAYQAITAPEKELKLTPETSVSAPAEELEERLLQPAVPVEFDDIAYIIDSGHGGAPGEMVGATIKGYGVNEMDYVLDVGNEVANLLKAMGYTGTEQTRTGIDPKLTLGKRKEIINMDGKNVGVSIHINGCGDSSVRGVRVYYNNAEAKEACKHVAEALKPIFGKASVKPNNSWRVMTGDAPVVYVELGFGGSNAEDARILMERKDDIVNAIASALAGYHSAQ